MIFNAFADAVLGIAVGTGSRMVLRHRHWLVRAIVSAALALVGLVVLGRLTGARSGIGPLQLLLTGLDLIERAGVRLAALPVFGPPPRELRDVAQIVLAVTVSWVTLRAWSGPRQGSGLADKTSLPVEPPLEAGFETPLVDPPLPAASRLPKFSVKSLLNSRLKAASVARRQVGAPSPARRQPSLRAKSRRRVASASRAVSRPRTTARNFPRIGDRLRPSAFRRRRLPPPRRAAPIAPTRIAPRKSSWLGILRAKPHVRLAAHEEHRCPYCLEEVQPRDPRGSIECPVCHTFHHKDCWDITGTCQVPHLNV